MSLNNEAQTMGLDTESRHDEALDASMPSKQSSELDTDLENEILDRVVNSGATFKSQQKDDPELTSDEKREIALGIIHKSRALFLCKFGEYLKKEHLVYFVDDEDYEISYHTKRLKRYFDKTTRQIDVRNRRYQALKTLVEKGEYFSETEMMRRNPLLYDNLIGQYLSEDERKKRDNIDTTNITFVNLLLESIERDRQKSVKKSQLDAEEQSLEENDSDEDTDENDDEKETKNKRNDAIYSHWGEMPGSSNNSRDRQHRDRLSARTCNKNISLKERQVLREEFVTHMYENFLNGKDIEFDYSTVDDNEAYDNINIRSQDEEEKYFDSESPETVLLENVRDDNDSEDELDIYMRSLKHKSPTRSRTSSQPISEEPNSRRSSR